MKEDQERWNKRFQDRPLVVPKSPGCLLAFCDQLEPGRVIDIASGDGAAALYLAERGYEVTAADISEVALDRLYGFASSMGKNVNTVEVDLDHADTLSTLGLFDNVVLFHFKPKPEYWPTFVSLLRPGGKLLLSTFNVRHHQDSGFSKRFCLEQNEFVDVSDQLILEHYESVLRNGDHMDDYLFRRR